MKRVIAFINKDTFARVGGKSGAGNSVLEFYR